MMVGEKEILPSYRGTTHFSQNKMFSDSIKIDIYALEKPFQFMNPKEIVNEEKILGSFVLKKI
ncbi:MAG: hypothetical protein R3E32_25090 [Chitinophagales bacterium]